MGVWKGKGILIDNQNIYTEETSFSVIESEPLPQIEYKQVIKNLETAKVLIEEQGILKIHKQKPEDGNLNDSIVTVELTSTAGQFEFKQGVLTKAGRLEIDFIMNTTNINILTTGK